MQTKTFADQVISACNAALVKAGFQLSRRTTRIIPLTGDIYGWVGLNRSKTGDAVRIDPFVGLHSVPIMRLWYELDTNRNLRYLLGQTATAAVHLGELAPDTRIFLFEPGSAPDTEAQRLAETVTNLGLPWMRAHARTESLLALFREREAMLGGYPERIAVSLFLLGRFDELSAYLDARLAEYAGKPLSWEEVAASWKQFAAGLRARLPIHENSAAAGAPPLPSGPPAGA